MVREIRPCEGVSPARTGITQAYTQTLDEQLRSGGRRTVRALAAALGLGPRRGAASDRLPRLARQAEHLGELGGAKSR